MFENVEIMRMAQSMATHAGHRHATIAANVAHADTPGYRARDTKDFATVYSGSGLQMRQTRTDHIGTDRQEHATEIDASAREKPNGNSVSVEAEIMKASQVRHDHDTALAIFKSSLDILRMSVGRR